MPVKYMNLYQKEMRQMLFNNFVYLTSKIKIIHCMKEYKYPLFFKFLYRFGNIPLTVLLVLFLLPVVINLDKDLFLLIPMVINLLMIYFLNRFYIFLYKIVPFKINVGDDMITCTEFIFSDKKIEISFRDIESLKGGLFEGRLNGVMRINSINNLTVGFFNSIENSKELETIVLSRVNHDVYDEVIRKAGMNKEAKVGK